MKDYIEIYTEAGISSHQFKLDDNNFLNHTYLLKVFTPSGMLMNVTSTVCGCLVTV
ncbi:hypothetical protein ACV566_09595 [Staphylococcus aureus]